MIDPWPVVDPSEHNDQDLLNTFNHLAYFLTKCVDGDLASHADLVRAQMDAFHRLAVETGTVIPADATLAQANDILYRRFGARDGANLAPMALQECVRVGIVAARTGGRRTRSALTGQGTVVGLFISDGGVPKRAVDTTLIGFRGAVGDRQKHRQHHGRPFQALCLWSTEVIEGLQAEGHPIGPGNAGENITVHGVEWATIRPGVRLQVGEVLAEVSSYADPCSFNAQWFSDRKFSRIDEERYPGWGRIYAWVVRPGSIGVGDTVVVEPAV